MRYTPDSQGMFAGQTGYGYRSIEAFVDACAAAKAGADLAQLNAGLASCAATLGITAILEAGRRSLDAGGRPVKILYADEDGVPGKGPVNALAKPRGFE